MIYNDDDDDGGGGGDGDPGDDGDGDGDGDDYDEEWWSWMKNVDCEWWMTCEDDDQGLMTDVDKYHTSSYIHSLIHMFSRKIKRNL